MNVPVKHKALRSIQIGRGFAAMLVVLYHINNSIWGIDKYFSEQFSQLFWFGNAGVQFFFVLSGFIIYLVHEKDIGARQRVLSFACKRFVRIYPVYWVVLFLVVMALYLAPGLGQPDQRSFWRILTSALLIPHPQPTILNVAWTLEHEVLFYAVFALMIFNAGLGKVAFVSWQIACLLNLFMGLSAFPTGVLLSANNLLFSFGIAAALAFRRGTCSRPGLVAVAGIAAFFALGLHEVYAAAPLAPGAYIVGFGASSAAAVFGSCVFERDFGLRAPRWLDTIGDASYSIYLVHFPLLSVLAKTLFATGLAALLPRAVCLALLICAVALAGIAFSKTIEMPLIAASSKLLPGRSRTLA